MSREHVYELLTTIAMFPAEVFENRSFEEVGTIAKILHGALISKAEMHAMTKRQWEEALLGTAPTWVKFRGSPLPSYPRPTSGLACVRCGSHRVQSLAWTWTNSGAPAGGEAEGDDFCADCEETTALTQFEPRSLCSSCDRAEWLTACPLRGVLIDAESGAVGRCDECAVFKSDEEARKAFEAECARSGWTPELYLDFLFTPENERTE